MTLNKLKQIRNQLKQSTEVYDQAFKNTALIAAEGLANQQKILSGVEHKVITQNIDKKYLIEKYGNLKTAKEEYKKIYGDKNYGKSWNDFINAVKDLPIIEKTELTLEQRVERIEKLLQSLGHQL